MQGDNSDPESTKHQAFLIIACSVFAFLPLLPFVCIMVEGLLCGEPYYTTRFFTAILGAALRLLGGVAG
jgi:hypothetical protein